MTPDPAPPASERAFADSSASRNSRRAGDDAHDGGGDGLDQPHAPAHAHAPGSAEIGIADSALHGPGQ